ncbi:hypothetical protein IAU60_000087 [Kwoniella sp. DSM 27419]
MIHRRARDQRHYLKRVDTPVKAVRKVDQAIALAYAPQSVNQPGPACAVVLTGLVFVLTYALPSMAYLALAQVDPPAQVRWLFLPLNPVRNFHLIVGMFRYAGVVARIAPKWIWAIARHVLWRDLSRSPTPQSTCGGLLQRSEGSHTRGWDQAHAQTSGVGSVQATGVLDDIMRTSIVYRVRDDGTEAKLDVYFDMCHSVIQVRPHLDARPATGVTPGPTVNQAPDIDLPMVDHHHNCGGKPSQSAYDGLEEAQKICGDASPGPTSIGNNRRSDTAETDPLPLVPIPTKPAKVIVFVHDIGMITPWPATKELYVLLGTKLARLGYVVVIPNIVQYPAGRIEDMVVDLRHVLSWTKGHLEGYGGSPTSIFLAGHGSGAHLALFTVTQDAVVRSLDSERRTIRLETSHRAAGTLGMLSSPDVPIESQWLKGKATRGGRETLNVDRDLRARMDTDWAGNRKDDIPNGLQGLNIYGEEVSLPELQGIIMLSPVADIIRQIRHESSLWLEHLSPLRRTYGPTQTKCMTHSVGHLLFASKRILSPRSLPKVMIIHGAQDWLVPFDSAHWLSELLYGLDIPVTFRPYRNMGHLDTVTSLMMGMEGTYTGWLERDSKWEVTNAPHEANESGMAVKNFVSQ